MPSLPVSPSPSASPSAATPHPRLLSLSVTGGYFDALHVSFAPHATCIIGGKGCGKTTLFEMLRFALGLLALTSTSPARALLRKNLGAGTVRVVFETRHGVRFVAERTLADERPRFFTADGEPVKTPPQGLLAEAYGQDEIEEVGSERPSQRRLLDRLAGDALAPCGLAIAQTTVDLRERAKVLLALEEEVTALESSAAEARAIEEQLRPLLVGTGEDAAIVTAAHAARGLRAREAQALGKVPGVLTELRGGAESFVAAARRKLTAIVPADARTGGNAALWSGMDRELARLDDVLVGLAQTVALEAERAGGVVAALAAELAAVHAEHDATYEALLARQEEDQARAGERTRLQARHAVVAPAVTALEERTRLHARLRAEHDALAERLAALRESRSALRLAVEERHRASLHADGVKIDVAVDKEDAAYRAYLRDLFAPLTNGQPKWLLDKIVPSLRPSELVSLVRAQDRLALMQRAGLEKHPERASQVIAALTSSVHQYELLALEIDDEVAIKTLHGEVWKDTTECSPGQRSGAILPILLLTGDAPLLIDQPDDNVDPDFMCSAILPRVAALDGARQFVFVTHHANVPVLSRSAHVVLIESDGLRGGTKAAGGIRPMRGWLLRKLEGGEGAFETRKKAYEPGQESAP